VDADIKENKWITVSAIALPVTLVMDQRFPSSMMTSANTKSVEDGYHDS
jgi:hypothetical protein